MNRQSNFMQDTDAGRSLECLPLANKPGVSTLATTIDSSFDSTIRFRLLAIVILVGFGLTLLTGCAGYHLGNQFLFRSDIRTVHVFMFESDSNRRFLGPRITEAVLKELEQKTPLTITERQLADSYIRGRILRDTKQVDGENRNDEPRSLSVSWIVEVDWVDRIGTPLMDRQTIRISEDAVFIPEGGQSISTAQQQIIERVARQVVSQMQTPW